MSISNAYDDSENKINTIPTIEMIYSGLKDTEIILDRGCYYGRCIGPYITLDIESRLTTCPSCSNSRKLSEQEVITIVESEQYNKRLTEKIWADRKRDNMIEILEIIERYKNGADE